MKTVNVHRLTVIAVLVPTLTVVASLWAVAVSSNAAIPSGSNAAEAKTITCDWEWLPETSSRWYQVPRHVDQSLTVRLVSDDVDLKGMRFHVYARRATDVLNNARAAPVGYRPEALISIGQSHSTDSALELAWTGEPGRGDTVYIQVVNADSLMVSYGLCTDPRFD